MNGTQLLNKDQLISVLSQGNVATAIHTGEEAVIHMANQAMLDIWGKDSRVIGKGLEEALPELRGQPFAKMFKRVWLEGITLSGAETAADLSVGGEVKTFYFDFEYRAIKDDFGQTICVLHTATDVTDRVLNRSMIKQVYDKEQALEREQALNEELSASNEELKAVNEELDQSHIQLNQLNEQLEARVLDRVKDLSKSELRYKDISDELAAINEELNASNEELISSNEALTTAQQCLQETYDQLEDKEIALRLTIEAANFGTWQIHSGSKNFITSARLRELFGFYPDQEITVEDALAQITEEYRPYVQQKLDNAMSGNGGYDVSYPVIGFHDQKMRWLRAIGNLKMDKAGEFSSFTGVVMDITPLKKDEQRKNDFIAMVSHELKTPLTSLNGYIQILQRKVNGLGNEFVNGSLDLAGKQVKKMTGMINGFLNVSRLESGKIVLSPSHFSLSELVETAVKEFRMIGDSQEVIFHGCEQMAVYADLDKISSVIANLLSNAVKYAPLGKQIVVTCRLIDNMAQVSVQDEGIGIQPQDIDKLFERYYRVKSDTHVSGFGIGLYLSAEIIARHNGRIWVDSSPGAGSTFYFSLPLNLTP